MRKNQGTAGRSDNPNDLQNYLRPGVVKLAQLMEYKLRLNDHKPDWTSEDLPSLFEKLEGETYELYDAINMETPRDAWLEAADVANMAMMVADNFEHNYEPEDED